MAARKKPTPKPSETAMVTVIATSGEPYRIYAITHGGEIKLITEFMNESVALETAREMREFAGLN